MRTVIHYAVLVLLLAWLSQINSPKVSTLDMTCSTLLLTPEETSAALLAVKLVYFQSFHGALCSLD